MANLASRLRWVCDRENEINRRSKPLNIALNSCDVHKQRATVSRPPLDCSKQQRARAYHFVVRVLACLDHLRERATCEVLLLGLLGILFD
jgi:hypothetical protein